MTESLFQSLDPVAALRLIAESPCLPNMAGECVGAVHSRRKRYDNLERVEVVGCPKHFAEAYLAGREAE